LPRFAVTRDGLNIAFETAGDGPPVLLMHGYASSAEQNWRAPGWIRSLVEAGFRTISFDFRGHGDSDKPHDPGMYGDKMLADAVAAMEAADAPTAAVIGYSMGGMLGIRLLLDSPERVRRLVAAGVGEHYFSRPLHYRKIADALQAPDDLRIANPLVRRFRAFATQKGKDRAALAACIRREFPRLPKAALAAAKRPVLVVAGDADESSGAPEPLAAAFPDGRALRLPGRNHMTAVGDTRHKRAATAFLEEDYESPSPPD
jgi:pimeloyl-ACP methyl ester carboxylesterase